MEKVYILQKAEYSHNKYSYKKFNGKFKILLADVLVGTSYTCSGNKNLVKPPDGYDSVSANDVFYIIYNNFHSYPLYLIEYEINNSPISFSANTNSIISVQPPLMVNNFVSTGNPPQQSILAIVKQDPPVYGKVGILGSKRITVELNKYTLDSSFDYFTVEDLQANDSTQWMIKIKGPKDTPYEGGIFKIKIIFHPQYPNNPPAVLFQTRIYHPCVDNNGRVCLGLLTHWQPVMDIGHLMLTISALLNDPSLEDPVDQYIALDYYQNNNGFKWMAADWTKKHAI